MGEKYGEVLFYRSEDLHAWTYVNKAWKGPEYGWMWECPDYFETEGGGVLLLSAMGFLKNDEKEKNQSLCFPVAFDESECRLEVLVDPNLIEVYINDGEYVISNAVYDLENKISCSKDKAIRLSTTGNNG